jgi:hypothetical protein
MNVFIPPNMAIVNTKEVFMVFDVKLSSSQFKGCLCPSYIYIHNAKPRNEEPIYL